MDPRRPSLPSRPFDLGSPDHSPDTRPSAPAAPAMWREAPAGIPSSARLLCPKCQGELATYERQGVHVEQCRDCRGIWLDRGELDHLIDAESSLGSASRSRPPAYRPGPRDDRYDDRRGSWSDVDEDDDLDDDDRRGRPGRSRSRFGDLFEGLLG